MKIIIYDTSNIFEHIYRSVQPVSLKQSIFKKYFFSHTIRGQLKILTKNAPNWIIVYVTSSDVKCGHEPNKFAGEGRND